MRRRTLFPLVPAAVATSPLSACAQAPIVIECSHVVAENTPKGKGPGLAQLRPGLVRRPRHLDAAAAGQLQAAFALIASALKERGR